MPGSPTSNRGLLRSLLIYYGLPTRILQWSLFYDQFIQPGDLAFDIGAHVGNRTLAMQRCGAKVVALEPNRRLCRFLRRWFGDAVVRQQAVGASSGEKRLLLSSRHPTVSTMSEDWARQVTKDASFAGVRWDASYKVEQTTLEELIAEFGEPAFCKIDVEGYELEVLRGLSRPIQALSFEYTPAALEIALASVEMLLRLGDYQLNVQIGESTAFVFPTWQRGSAIKRYLQTLQDKEGHRSGDVVARLTNL